MQTPDARVDPTVGMDAPSPHGSTPENQAAPDSPERWLELFERRHDEHLSADVIDEVLQALVALNPDAPVTPLRPDGMVVELPDSISLPSGNPVVEVRSAFDAVVYDDGVMSAWERAMAEGLGTCVAHPMGHPNVNLRLYMLDAREAHDVMVTIAVYESVDDQPVERPEIPETVPRFATISKDMLSNILKVDEAITKILGWSPEELLGHRTVEFIHPDDRELAVANWVEMLAATGPGRRVRLRHQHRDESWVWFEVTNHNLSDDPEHNCIVSEMVDISEEMAAHEALRAREQLLDRLAGAVPVGLFQVDLDRRIVYTNERLHEILGIEPVETLDAQLATVIAADRPQLDRALGEVLDEGAAADVEVQLRVPSSRGLRFCTISLRPLSLEDGTISGAIACVADVTDSARMREELKQRATFDELTGCYNRASIMLALEADIESGRGRAERGVAFVDLDCFKAVNDEHGHAVGDELLRVVAGRLRAAVREPDLVGRIGGDEFLVVCPDIGGPEQAMQLAERLAAAVREGAVSVGSGSIEAQVSVGVAWSSGDGVSADAIVAQADHAMYTSKREGAGAPKLARAA